jgi:hypothetical protein
MESLGSSHGVDEKEAGRASIIRLLKIFAKNILEDTKIIKNLYEIWYPTLDKN